MSPDAIVDAGALPSGVGPASTRRITRTGRNSASEIAELIAKGKLHAPIHATYDVSEIKEAVAVAASGGRSGKVLIAPRH